MDLYFLVLLNFLDLVERVMADDQANGERTIQAYHFLAMDGTHSSIAPPPVAANSFELKPILLQLIQNAGHFNGLAHEDPHQHLINFLEICESYKQNVVTPEALQMRIFKHSLSGMT